jgi:hypothetical protein
MQHENLVMREYGIEEIRERRDQAGHKSMDEDGDLCNCQICRALGGRLG